MFENDSVTTDNWKGVRPVRWTSSNVEQIQLDKKPLVKLDEPSEFMPINQQTAEEAYLAVLNHAGCSFPNRDAIDIRIIGEVRNGTATYGNGFISSTSQVGGWPTLANGTAPPDFDHDGMPNDWELANGLDSTDASDGKIVGADGYTNLEIYMNSIIEYPTTSISVPTKELVPNEIALAQNYPNPFNPSTKIGYYIPTNAKVRIDVYDMLGRKVAELVNEVKSAGSYEVNFEAGNLSSGVYIYQLIYSDRVLSRKMLLLQ
jgi:hypothetical protein